MPRPLDRSRVPGGGLASRPDKVSAGCEVAIHGLDPGIPAGMTAEWVLAGVLITLAGPILS